jgi:hypothetical protein
LEYKYEKEEEFVFVAVDQAGNVGKETVKLTIAIPELEIDTINYLGAGAEVIAELSHDLDYGKVRFEKNRMGYRQPLDPDIYPVQPLDPEVIGGLFPYDDEIGLFDAQ